MAKDEIYVARDSGVIYDADGTPVVVHKGVTRIRSGHPLLEGNEELFEVLSVDYDVEDTTARPTQKRTGGRTKSGDTKS